MAKARTKKRKNAKTKKRKRKQQRQEESAEKLLDDLASDTAAIFTCSSQLIDHWAHHCGRLQEDLEYDLIYSRIAIEIWKEHPGLADDVTAVLEDFATESQGRLSSIEQLATRFAALADDEDNAHKHLDRVEHYRDLIHLRISQSNEASEPQV